MITLENVAIRLSEMFQYTENGVKGRFKISREDLRRLSENKFFENDLPELQKHLLKRNLLLIDNGDTFGCMCPNLVNSWREPKIETVFKHEFKNDKKPIVKEDVKHSIQYDKKYESHINKITSLIIKYKGIKVTEIEDSEPLTILERAIYTRMAGYFRLFMNEGDYGKDTKTLPRRMLSILIKDLGSIKVNKNEIVKLDINEEDKWSMIKAREIWLKTSNEGMKNE